MLQKLSKVSHGKLDQRNVLLKFCSKVGIAIITSFIIFKNWAISYWKAEFAVKSGNIFKKDIFNRSKSFTFLIADLHQDKIRVSLNYSIETLVLDFNSKEEQASVNLPEP